MIEIKNPDADHLYSLRGKRVYAELFGTFFHAISDLGVINAVVQSNTEIEVVGEYEDLKLERIGLKTVHENDLEMENPKDTFLFKVKYFPSLTQIYFFEYEEEPDDEESVAE